MALITAHGFVRPVDETLAAFMRRSDRVYAAHPLLAFPPPLHPHLAFGGDSDARADRQPVSDPPPEPDVPDGADDGVGAEEPDDAYAEQPDDAYAEQLDDAYAEQPDDAYAEQPGGTHQEGRSGREL